MKEMITVEKEVYEAVLRNSVRVSDLEAENQQLKKLLMECHYGFRKLPIYNLVGEDEAREVNKLLNKIDNAIGEKK